MVDEEFEMKFQFRDYAEEIGLSFADKDIDFLRLVWEDGWHGGRTYRPAEEIESNNEVQ